MGGICSNNDNILNKETNFSRNNNDVKNGDEGQVYFIEKKHV